MSAGLAFNKGHVAISPAEQLVVPVLSAPRSGGALVARLLDRLGADLGWPLSPVGPDNPRGAWEHSLFSTLNRQLLAGLGCDADGLESPGKLLDFSHRMSRVDLSPVDEEQIRSRIAINFMQPVWAFKDTRTALTWTLWSRLFAGFGYSNVRPIVIVRHPDACLDAMVKRGEASAAAARSELSVEDFVHSMWWGVHQVILGSELDESATLVVHLEDLLNPQTAPMEVARIAHHVGEFDLDVQQKALDSLDFVQQQRRGPPQDPNLAELHAGLVALAEAQQASFRGRAVELPSLAGGARTKKDSASQVPAPFCIYQVSPVGYPHSSAFDEVALSLHHGFAKLGIAAPLVRDVREIQGTPIVVGANLIEGFVDTLDVAKALPHDSILYNLEQVDPTSDWMKGRYLSLLRRFRVWDYSPANAQRLLEMGIRVEGVCGIGYVPELERIAQDVSEDIDVLFYGAINDRRRVVLEALQDRGLNVVVAANCFGEARDRLVARSKIVLNIHFYEAKVLEMVRISYLLANGQCVVSEVGVDREEEAFFQEGIAFAPYDGLVDRCIELVERPDERRRIAGNAKTIFSGLSQAHFLSELLP